MLVDKRALLYTFVVTARFTRSAVFEKPLPTEPWQGLFSSNLTEVFRLVQKGYSQNSFTMLSRSREKLGGSNEKAFTRKCSRAGHERSCDCSGHGGAAGGCAPCRIHELERMLRRRRRRQ